MKTIAQIAAELQGYDPSLHADQVNSFCTSWSARQAQKKWAF